jgi:hypothetical protein
MKIKKLYSIAFACLIISVILSIVIYTCQIEEGIVGLIALIIFSITAILIPASLTFFIKNFIKDKFYSILLVLLLGVTSCIIYFILLFFSKSILVGGGEGGMIWGGILIIWGLIIGLLSIIIDFVILFKKVDKQTI